MRQPELRRIHAIITLCTGCCLILAGASSSAAAASSKSSVSVATTPTTSSSVPTSNSDGTGEECTQHADFVRRQLGERLDRVLSGRRQRDVAQWIKEGRPGIGGGDAERAFVVSASAQVESSTLLVAKRTRTPRKDDPFPANRFSLELVEEDEVVEDVPSNNLLLEDDGVGSGVASADVTNASNASNASALQTASRAAPSPSISTRVSTLTCTLIARTTWMARLGVRAVQLSWNFAPVSTTVGLAYLSPTFRNHYWYKWLAHSMGKSGPAFIKWGQWSSTRPDLFPEAFCDALSTLHSNAPAHAWSHSESTLEEALRLSPLPSSSSYGLLSAVFDELDPEPLASGSIAQVHKAVLDGRLVAVKIRHPHVERLMEMDFTLMNVAAAVLDRALPLVRWLHIRETLHQFGTSLKAQADLSVEANHLERLNHNFRTWPHVRFPRPLLATSAVIIETFEPGRIVTTFLDMYEDLAQTINREESLAHRAAIDTHLALTTSKVEHPPSFALVASGGSRKGEIVERAAAPTHPLEANALDNHALEGHHLIPTAIAKFIVTTGLGVYLKMLLVDNLMHADLHPGNIMVHFHRHLHHQHPSRRKRDWRRRIRVEPSDLNESMLAMVPPRDAQVAAGKATGGRRLDRLLGICLVDAGMVAELNDREGSTFIGLLSSLGEGDGASAADFALGFSLENHLSDQGRSDFRLDMVELFAERCWGYGSNVEVGHVLRGILGLIRKHRIRIDANFATLVVNCLCIESLARAVCPSYNVLDAARPLLRSYRKLFYDRDGTPKVGAKRSRWWVKAWLSLMYVAKNSRDRRFFRREERLNQSRTRAPRLLLEIPS